MNLIFGWVWILFGFISGALIGMFFHKENWLGGYGSHCRRFVRLGHISFLGLGILNILYGFTAQGLHGPTGLLLVISWCFVLGGISMPVACGLMAIKGHLRPFYIFFTPVTFLMTGTLLVLYFFTHA